MLPPCCSSSRGQCRREKFKLEAAVATRCHHPVGLVLDGLAAYNDQDTLNRFCEVRIHRLLTAMIIAPHIVHVALMMALDIERRTGRLHRGCLRK